MRYSQHGFKRGLGTTSQLTRTTHFIQKSINDEKTCHAVSLDLSKAFDCVNHNALTHKLLEENIDISIVKMVESYLSNRKVQGKFLNEICDPVHQPYGVPQGSVLGPIIFNLYISDIPQSADLSSQYADDIMIMNNGRSPQQAKYLAERNQELLEYYHRWGLKCNAEKTQTIIFGRQHRARAKRSVEVVDPQTRNIVVLETTRKLSYLGITISRTLQITPHSLKRLTITKHVINCLQGIIGKYSGVDAYIKWRVIRACILPSMNYGTECLLPLYNKSTLKKMEICYKKILKQSAGLPTTFPTEDLW